MTARSLHHRGFTLVELMCSMAIGSMILLAAASLLGSSGDGYERVGGGVAADREARALITQLAADLSTARFHKDGVFDKSSLKWPQDRLGFLSLQAPDAQSDEGRIGDLCAVNYYVKDLTVGGRNIRCLMRGFRESAETFKALENKSVKDLFSDQDKIDEPVAFGVVSFEARPKSRDKAGQWIDWVENDDHGPQALEVKLVVARRGLVGRLKQASDWDGGGQSDKWLGEPAEVQRNEDLETYGTLIQFGNDANS